MKADTTITSMIFLPIYTYTPAHLLMKADTTITLICLNLHICIHTYRHTHNNSHIHAHTHPHTHTHTHKHTHTSTPINESSHDNLSLPIHTYILAHLLMKADTTITLIFLPIHTYIHTHWHNS